MWVSRCPHRHVTRTILHHAGMTGAVLNHPWMARAVLNHPGVTRTVLNHYPRVAGAALDHPRMAWAILHHARVVGAILHHVHHPGAHAGPAILLVGDLGTRVVRGGHVQDAVSHLLGSLRVTGVPHVVVLRHAPTRHAGVVHTPSTTRSSCSRATWWSSWVTTATVGRVLAAARERRTSITMAMSRVPIRHVPLLLLLLLLLLHVRISARVAVTLLLLHYMTLTLMTRVTLTHLLVVLLHCTLK